MRERVADGRLVVVLPAPPALVTEIHAVWPAGPSLPVRVRAAIDALVDGMSAGGMSAGGMSAGGM